MAAWYDAENDWKRMREMENRREGEKEEKTGFPASFISAILPFTCYCKTKTIKKRNPYISCLYFQKNRSLPEKNYTCVKAPN